MNFSFELEDALLTGNINPEAIIGMETIFWAIFWWLAMIRVMLCIAIAVFMIISLWRVFKKAWLPGRGVLVPVYNIVLFFQLWGMSGRWTLAILFPPLLRVVSIVNTFNITKKFWKHRAFGLGLIFLELIFIPILAFDDSKYLGKKSINKPVTAKPIAATIKKPVKKIIKKAPTKKTTKKTPAKKIIKKKK